MLTKNPSTGYKRMIGNSSSALKKGAWTPEEDMILKNYIQKFGEGKWHLLAVKTGLNRCRKSCRLRWVNYLRPNIKRGGFQKDEVDLMHRLHKLLGNKWSLIAGRIPGRTANDIKNYWNTHVLSRSTRKKLEEKEVEPSQDMKVQVVKPQAQKASKPLDTFPQIAHHDKSNFIISSSSNNGFDDGFVISPPVPSGDMVDECLEKLFGECEKEMDDEKGWSLPIIVNPEGGGLDVGQEDGGGLFIPMDDFFWSFLD